MSYLETDLSGISVNGDYQDLKIGDIVWIETSEITIKNGEVVGYNIQNALETLTIRYLIHEELEIDVDDIMKIEVQ